MSSILDVLHFPLWGTRLIEASAGTGKTWTIAALYLRLVLGHAGPDGEGEAAVMQVRVPSEILVMTFTKAATRELSDRIRSRLLEAARCFRGEAQPQEGDMLLAGLMQAYPEGPARAGAAWRLSVAAESMDDAAVHTIDAWCQRMLREHAFDSGCLFDEELSANETAMQTEAAHDYWRQQVYPLHAQQLDTVLGVWPTVGALTEDARKLVEKEVPAGAGDGSLGDLIDRLRGEQHTALSRLKAGWAERAREMQAWLDVQLSARISPFGKGKPQKHHCTRWLNDLAAWAADPSADALDLGKGAEKLTHTCMQEALLPDAKVKLPEHFAAFESLMQAISRLRPVQTLKAALRLHAAARIARRLAELKEQAGTFGFADMLARLDKALDETLNGDNARRLRARILAQYPVALIDEFQDTSPVQSRIFDRLYRLADNDPRTTLLLIGDPKQAIYGFRGADIYSYLDARRKTDGRHYVLGTNHRSTGPLVNAVNHVFAQAEARPGHGAFMFRTDASAAALGSSLAAGPLPFIPVKAAGRAESFVTSEGACPAVTLALDEDLASGTIHMRQFAARCAERIVTLLNDREAGFQHPGKGFRRLRPADIAVLVRTGREGAAVKRELRRRNVASVYLSDTESVFDSEEARDLLPWLRAVASPRDAGLARAAFATRSVGLSIEELAELAADDVAFDLRSEQLRILHRTWQEQGVLTMLRQSLHLLELPARWLGAAEGTHDRGYSVAHDGERKLTNYLHLAELLQNASAQLDGEQALIRWLANQLDAHGVGDDEQVVRLESDADLVKLVTVHKAKGLEYPLVFLPFPYIFRPVSRKDTTFVTLPAASARTLVMEPTGEEVAAADRERLREDLRLLYVALTRARHALWVGSAAFQRAGSACLWHESAIGYVLGGSQPVDADALRARIAALVEPGEDIALVPATPVAEIGRTLLVPRDAPSRLRPPPTYVADFDRRWSIGSFSALVRALPSAALWASSTAAVRDDEALQPALQAEGDEDGDLSGQGGEGEADRDEAGRDEAGRGLTAQRAEASALPDPVSVAPPGPVEQLLKPWHRFPRGAFPGNFLHDQLEWLGEEGFGLQASQELQQQLLRRCERQGWGHRGDDVVAWLGKALSTPLPPLGVALDALTGHLPEMEFWFPSESLPSRRIDELCRARTLSGRERPALPERELRGMLMGFADLVFAHGGRYWVLDYKSNHLGMSDSDYGEDALQQAMAAHRYDVQAAIYLVALHRLLQVRLGAAYIPARHLGGAIYFFLRGIEGPTRGCYVVKADPKLLDGIDALLRATDEAET